MSLAPLCGSGMHLLQANSIVSTSRTFIFLSPGPGRRNRGQAQTGSVATLTGASSEIGSPPKCGGRKAAVPLTSVSLPLGREQVVCDTAPAPVPALQHLSPPVAPLLAGSAPSPLSAASQLFPSGSENTFPPGWGRSRRLLPTSPRVLLSPAAG